MVTQSVNIIGLWEYKKYSIYVHQILVGKIASWSKCFCLVFIIHICLTNIMFLSLIWNIRPKCKISTGSNMSVTRMPWVRSLPVHWSMNSGLEPRTESSNRSFYLSKTTVTDKTRIQKHIPVKTEILAKQGNSIRWVICVDLYRHFSLDTFARFYFHQFFPDDLKNLKSAVSCRFACVLREISSFNYVCVS